MPQAPPSATTPEEAGAAEPAEPLVGRAAEPDRREPRPLLVLGIGNPDSPADAGGRRLARQVAGELAAAGGEGGGVAPPVVLKERTGTSFEILDAWQGFERVLVVDAVAGGTGEPEIRRFDATAAPLPATLGSTSSHGWGVAEAVELARALGRLPRELEVWAVPAEQVPGAGA